MSFKRLPPGWDSKLEPKSGKSYFVNYFTRNISLDDPRIKPNSEQTQSNQDNFRNGRHVPLMGASAVHSTSQAAAMTDIISRIRHMFPTVPETHIKALLIKYHGREAVVVSALQVEKHPVRTPGPFTPPPPVRPPVPIACRPQPKPHSPKMKLRYLKSVFPVVEETILLDTLVNADNNVTHATEKLLTLGFNKREMPQPRVCLKKQESEPTKTEIKKSPKLRKMKSAEEKQLIKQRICKKHPEVAERVVSIALDSAGFNEETAETILAMMLDEQKKSFDSSGEVVETEKVVSKSPENRTEAIPIEPIRPDQNIKQRHKNNKNEIRTPVQVETESEPLCCLFMSPLLTKPQGPNKDLHRGPDETLLLEDYVPWIGPEKGLAKGPERGLAKGSSGAKGPNPLLRKGPCPSLAKGSIYSNLIAVQDSRGK
ncbi:unnamed protein product [Nezara viridula]|uniref:Uncharacterized protein n=1 Tax=Nezara viridula TaxID=85310 RepID=A0A9P0H3N4_NEZVI|nr:unnamed protein product [Nezara viridula]